MLRGDATAGAVCARSLFVAAALVASTCTPRTEEAAAPSIAQDDESAERGASLESGERVEMVPTRPGVTLPVLVAVPRRAPTAIVVLFPGGDGVLGLSSGGLAHGADNFMVRTRQRFADEGFVAVVVDVPSDHPHGGDDYRLGDKEAEDVRKLLAWAVKRWPLPAWLVGTSRGTISAANAVVRGADAHGLVLTSSVTAGPKASLADIPVARINVPTLVVHNRLDACEASPFDGAVQLEKTLIAPARELRALEGGITPRSRPCGPRSFHGFYGRDAEAVSTVATYIRAH